MEKQPHEYWYYFGSCTPYPKQIPEGWLPHPPYKRFNSKEECQAFIDKGGSINPIEDYYQRQNPTK